ncbi:GNAT family N-acetyltransferase [Flavobacteriaceae bacterium R38]|nr:GNAT family N-acetyltransferase [Flavobacteriaceae bacterium R38]
MYSIAFVKNENIKSVIPFLEQLNPNISAQTLSERLEEMLENGYKCVGVYDGEKLIGVSGIWILVKYYIGKHIELDNVCLLPEYRNKGIGKLLTDWTIEYAQSIGCNAAELNCYLNSKASQRFWKNQDFEIVGYHFQKKF